MTVARGRSVLSSLAPFSPLLFFFFPLFLFFFSLPPSSPPLLPPPPCNQVRSFTRHSWKQQDLLPRQRRDRPPSPFPPPPPFFLFFPPPTPYSVSDWGSSSVQGRGYKQLVAGPPPISSFFLFSSPFFPIPPSPVTLTNDVRAGRHVQQASNADPLVFLPFSFLCSHDFQQRRYTSLSSFPFFSFLSFLWNASDAEGVRSFLLPPFSLPSPSGLRAEEGVSPAPSLFSFFFFLSPPLGAKIGKKRSDFPLLPFLSFFSSFFLPFPVLGTPTETRHAQNSRNRRSFLFSPLPPPLFFLFFFFFFLFFFSFFFFSPENDGKPPQSDLRFESSYQVVVVFYLLPLLFFFFLFFPSSLSPLAGRDTLMAAGASAERRLRSLRSYPSFSPSPSVTSRNGRSSKSWRSFVPSLFFSPSPPSFFFIPPFPPFSNPSSVFLPLALVSHSVSYLTRRIEDDPGIRVLFFSLLPLFLLFLFCRQRPAPKKKLGVKGAEGNIRSFPPFPLFSYFFPFLHFSLSSFLPLSILAGV